MHGCFCDSELVLHTQDVLEAEPSEAGDEWIVEELTLSGRSSISAKTLLRHHVCRSITTYSQVSDEHKVREDANYYRLWADHLILHLFSILTISVHVKDAPKHVPPVC